MEFNYLIETPYFNESKIVDWISEEIEMRGFTVGDLMFHFVSDEDLLEMNKEFLNHDTYTDIITFDYTMGKLISGEVFISVERVKENAVEFKVTDFQELLRVMIHGILHLCGMKDESEYEQIAMRKAEDEALKRFTL